MDKNKIIREQIYIFFTAISFAYRTKEQISSSIISMIRQYLNVDVTKDEVIEVIQAMIDNGDIESYKGFENDIQHSLSENTRIYVMEHINFNWDK